MIQDYFEFLKTVACNSPMVEEFRLIREFRGMGSGYIRFVLKLVDDSEFHIFEHVDSNLHKTHYSYHWQDKKKTTILRWDNAPHHPEIKTFPHHVHEKESVRESEEVTFAEMLREIEGRFKKLR